MTKRLSYNMFIDHSRPIIKKLIQNVQLPASLLNNMQKKFTYCHILYRPILFSFFPAVYILSEIDKMYIGLHVCIDNDMFVCYSRYDRMSRQVRPN